MSFKSYRSLRQLDGSWLLDDPQPLVFSGRHGLIARHVLGQGAGAEKPWRLGATDVQALAFTAPPACERLIVFEQVENGTLELLALEAIHGISHERTEMMFRFRPLILLGRAPGLRVRTVATTAIYNEELSLDGGAWAPAGSWHWRRPHLALGGVVCGATPGE